MTNTTNNFKGYSKEFVEMEVRNQIQKEKDKLIEEFEKIIENERVYPDYQNFKQPAEAITQFKIRLKQQIKELKSKEMK